MLQSRVNVGSIVDKANLMQQSSCGKEESYSISELERKSNRLCIGHCSADIYIVVSTPNISEKVRMSI